MTFFSNGSYVMLRDGDSIDDQSEMDGMERGTYTWNEATGEFSATAITDTNGEWGLSHPLPDFTFMVENDVLTITEVTDSFTLNRVDDALPEAPTLESLIIGQTYYVTTCDHVETLVFGTDGQATVTGIENGVEYSETYVYSIEGGVATVIIPDEGTHTFTNPVVLTDWIAFTDAEGQETGSFFFDYDTVESTLSYDCGSASPAIIPITQADLTSNTFYNRDTDDLGYGYGKITFTATEATRHEIWCNTDGSLRSDDIFYFPIALIDAMLRADITQLDQGYMWFTLISEDVSTWIVSKESDLEMDAVDGIEAKQEEWFLSKPTDFPAL